MNIENILQPKSKKEVKKTLREMPLWDFLIHFRNKSLIKYWGIGIKKKMMHGLIRWHNFMWVVHVIYFIQIVIGNVWNIIFPWTPMWKMSWIEHMFVSAVIFSILFAPFTIAGYFINEKTKIKEARKELEKFINNGPAYMGFIR